MMSTFCLNSAMATARFETAVLLPDLGWGLVTTRTCERDW